MEIRGISGRPGLSNNARHPVKIIDELFWKPNGCIIVPFHGAEFLLSKNVQDQPAGSWLRSHGNWKTLGDDHGPRYVESGPTSKVFWIQDEVQPRSRWQR